jgi:AraC-like DNA-binding protein
MFWLSLGDGAFQRSVIHAIDRAGHPWRRLPDVSSFTPGDGVLITDLSPDPAASLDHLSTAFDREMGAGVVLLVDPANTETLRVLLLGAAGIPILDVIVEGQADGQDLDRALRGLVDRDSIRRLRDEVMALLGLPDPAGIMVVHLCGIQPVTTVRGLQSRLEWGRKRVESEVRACGFAKPKEFVRAVRVAAATCLLRRGHTVKDVALRLSYGSVDTLSGHARSVLGVVPSAVRGLDGESLRRLFAAS